MAYPSPPPPPGYDPSRPARLRGHTGIRVGAILSIVGLALLIAGVALLAVGSLGKIDKFQRVRVADGSGTVHFSKSGGYVAYYEASDVTNSDNQRIPLVHVQLTGPSGQQMTLHTLYGGGTTTIKKLTYNFHGHHGAALYQFHIDQPGTYHVEVAALNTPSDATIAFGTSIVAGTVTGALLTIAGVLLLVAGLIVLIIGLVRRRNHKRQLATATGYYGQPAYPPPGYGPPGQPPPGYTPPGYPSQGYAPPSLRKDEPKPSWPPQE